MLSNSAENLRRMALDAHKAAWTQPDPEVRNVLKEIAADYDQLARIAEHNVAEQRLPLTLSGQNVQRHARAYPLGAYEGVVALPDVQSNLSLVRLAPGCATLLK